VQAETAVAGLPGPGDFRHGAGVLVGHVEYEGVLGAAQEDPGRWAPVPDGVGRQLGGGDHHLFRDVVQPAIRWHRFAVQSLEQAGPEPAQLGRIVQHPVPDVDGAVRRQ
jgi:hypothetical protein